MATTTKAKAAATPTPRSNQKLAIGFGTGMTAHVGYKAIADEARSPIKAQYVCPEHGPGCKQRYMCSPGTPQEHLMPEGLPPKGYPNPDDPSQLVIVNKADLDEIAEQKDGIIEVKAYVDVDTIDPIYFAKTHFLWPQAGIPLNEQTFDVFAAALRVDRKAAVATVVLAKQTVQIVIHWSDELGTLVFHTCYFNSQIRQADAEIIKAGAVSRDATISNDHLKLARMVIEMNAGEFDASEVDDTYTPKLEAVIRASAKGTKYVPVVVDAEPVAPAADLLGALQASVEAAKTAKKPAAKKPAAKSRAKQPA
jgi:DNA end-binding protein Ku